ncbi:MAG: IPTL-CTERM sorting domain-containing protein [Pseudomonadota bacterium]
MSGFLSRAVQRHVRKSSWFAALLALATVPQALAGFPNGGFESDLANWNVSSAVMGSTIPTFPPTTEAHLGLTPVADNGLTSVVGAGTSSQTGNALSFPLYESKAARINYGGNSNRSSAIDQTATMTLADVDPADGKVHIRFAVAPVLQNPGHAPNQQPYFFVEVTNITKGNAQLFHTFNFSGQTGVPWVTVGGYQYTDWQAIDIAPGPGILDVGDQVKVKIIATGCGQGGHEGHIYVDSGAEFTTLPGPYIQADGPDYVSAGSTITYTYIYGNTGTAPLTNTTVTVVSPQDNHSPVNNLTFASTSGVGCTDPGVGNAGTVSCNFGTLNPGSTGTFTVTYNVPATTTGPINHGNYKVSGDAVPAVLGPLVQTAVTASPLVNMGATITDGETSVSWGDNLTYTIVVSNTGPTDVPIGATIVESLPANLINATWTCVASAGTSCPNANGTGAINETMTATLPVAETLTYTVSAQVNPAGVGVGTVNHSVTVTAPGGVLDSDSSNNTAADIDSVGASLVSLTVNKTGATQGSVVSVPAGISVSCLGDCSDALNYPDGSEVILYASAPAGSIFTGWSGGSCSGTEPSCSVTLSGNTVVTASFSAPFGVTPVVGAHGSVSPNVTQPVAPGGTTSFNVVPEAGYAAVITDNCAAGGAETGGTLSGTTYTTNAIAQSCNVNFSFVGLSTVTPSVGSGGSVTPNTPLTVLPGGSVSYTVIPNSGNQVAVSGTCPAGSWAGDVYTISPVTEDCSVNFVFGTPPQAQNDTVPSGQRTMSVIGNDTAGSNPLNPATVDLDPLLAGRQTSVTNAQGTWTVDNAGNVTFAPAPGFYDTASLDYAVSDTAGFVTTATVTCAIDPSGVVYDSQTRQPVAGASVTILYNGGDASAYVLGGVTTVTTDADGRYAFWLVNGPVGGTFSLTVSRSGYRFVSQFIPPQAGGWDPNAGPVTAINGAPQVGDPTTYYLSGPYPNVDVTNNNIPLDPIVPVPTLGEWGKILLMLLVVVTAGVMFRRQKSWA